MTPLEIVGIALTLIGGIMILFYGVQILILAFQASIFWGLGCLLIPFVDLIFVVVHWDTTKTPFLRILLAMPLVIVGYYLAPSDYL